MVSNEHDLEHTGWVMKEGLCCISSREVRENMRGGGI